MINWFFLELLLGYNLTGSSDAVTNWTFLLKTSEKMLHL